MEQLDLFHSPQVPSARRPRKPREKAPLLKDREADLRRIRRLGIEWDADLGAQMLWHDLTRLAEEGKRCAS